MREETEMEIMEKIKSLFSAEDDYEDGEYEEEFEEPQYIKEPQKLSYRKQKTSNVVNLNRTEDMRVVLYEPLKDEDVEKMIYDVKDNKVVIVNLHLLDGELAARVFYSLTGAICALEGEMREISTGIYVVVPRTVEVEGVKNELKSKVFFA